MDFRISMGLFPYFTEIIGKILLGISADLRFQARCRFQHLRPRFQLVVPRYINFH